MTNSTGNVRAHNVLDNLIYRREIPVMLGVFINPGRTPEQPEPTPQNWGDRDTNRPTEYNSLDDRYARVIVDELLPALEKDYNLSKDPERRGIGGASSGAIAAFTVAWERPAHFRKVLSIVGSFVNLRGGDAYADLVLKTDKKPLRVFLQDGRNDADVAGFRKLLTGWPSPIVMAGAELSEALPYPGASLDQTLAWTPNHPVADVYRAFKPMPHDAPSRALAAVLHAVGPDEGHFDLSAPGTITIGDDGRTRFAPSPSGKHRYLIARPDQKERVLQTYVQLVSAQPPPRPGRGRPAAGAGAAATMAVVGLAAWLATSFSTPVSGQVDEFETAVRPLLTDTCARCHNGQLVSGGLNVTEMATPGSLVEHRETWEKVLRRLRAGDMPPTGTPRPPKAQLDAMTAYVERAFERADAATPQDPGRITARRLNRTEYTNTIRDLLGVRFRAERYFPADDSGDGFDNIGEVLTVSPLLMERYLSAAERIAAWTVSTEIPARPLEMDYRARDRKIRRVDRSTIEAEHRVEFAGDYTVRIGLPGERPQVDGRDAAPVTLGFWMDGTLLASQTVQTRPSGLVYFDPYSEEELKVYLPEGDHVFRAGFIDDPFVAALANADAYDRRKNKFLDSMVFVGPFASATPKASRAQILSCDRRPAGPASSASWPAWRAGPTAVRRHAPRSTR